MDKRFLTAPELAQFDPVRLIQGLHPLADPETGKFERELCEQYGKYLSRILGKHPDIQILPQGTRAPLESFRDLTTSTASSFVGTKTTEGNVGIPILGAGNVLAELGARIEPDLRENLAIPYVDDELSLSAEAGAEGSAATESTPTVDIVSWTPHEIAGWAEASRKLFQQSGRLKLVTAALVAKLRWQMIHDALHGATANDEINGLANNGGVSSEDGAGFSWTSAHGAVKTLAARGVERMAWLVSPADHETLSIRPREGGGEKMLIEDGKMAGLPIRASNAVTSGTAFLGDWSYLLIASWGGVDLIVNPYSKDLNGLIRITARIYVDVQPTNPRAFLKVTGLT